MNATGFSLTLDLKSGYTQAVTFDDESIPPIVIDEAPPLGVGAGPNPARALGAAVGGCLGASLLFCLRRAHIDVEALNTTVHGTLARNDRGRLRVTALDVSLEVSVPAEQHERVQGCLSVFEDYCVVTASIQPAIAVNVRVEITKGQRESLVPVAG